MNLRAVLFDFGMVRGQHHDRSDAPLAEAPTNVTPVDIRQAEVEHDEVGTIRHGARDAVLAGRCFGQALYLAREGITYDCANFWLVFDDEHAGSIHGFVRKRQAYWPYPLPPNLWKGLPLGLPLGLPPFRLRHPEGLFPPVPPLLTFYPNDTIVG